MKKMFKITNNLLTEKVKENLTKIRNNQKVIRDLLKQKTFTETKKLEKKFSTNKSLLDENFEFINIQLTICNFLEKNIKASSFGNNTTANLLKDINDCFELTIDGFIIYNSEHPFYSDDKFFNNLLNYHQKLENYEKIRRTVTYKKQQ